MMFFLMLLLVAFIMAKSGLYLMGQGIKEDEYDQAAEDRLIQYKAWLKGNGRVVNKGCIDGEHAPMVLFNRENPSKIDNVICSKCTDTLPTPAEYSCDACSVIGLDGYLHVEQCTKHDKELVLS